MNPFDKFLRPAFTMPAESAMDFFVSLKRGEIAKEASELATNDPGEASVTEDETGPPVEIVDPPSGLPGRVPSEPPPPAWVMKELVEENATLSNAIEALEQQAGEASQAAEAASQQAQTSGEQAAQAGEQAAQVSQHLQMAQQEGMAAKEQAMQAQEGSMRLRQAVQGYREQLLNLALQDPTPPELVVAAPGQPPVAGQPPQEGAVGPDGAPVPPQGQPGAPPPAPPAGAPPAGPAAQAAGVPGPPPMGMPGPGGAPMPPGGAPTPAPGMGQPQGVKPVAQPKQPKVKQSSVSAATKARILGALAGAGALGTAQALSSRSGASGKSGTELGLEARVAELRAQHKNRPPGALGKHRLSGKQHQLAVARTNREHPRAATGLAALLGAGTGALAAPHVVQKVRKILGK